MLWDQGTYLLITSSQLQFHKVMATNAAVTVISFFSLILTGRSE